MDEGTFTDVTFMDESRRMQVFDGRQDLINDVQHLLAVSNQVVSHEPIA